MGGDKGCTHLGDPLTSARSSSVAKRALRCLAMRALSKSSVKSGASPLEERGFDCGSKRFRWILSEASLMICDSSRTEQTIMRYYCLLCMQRSAPTPVPRRLVMLYTAREKTFLAFRDQTPA